MAKLSTSEAAAPATPRKALPPLPPIADVPVTSDVRQAAAALVASGGPSAARIAACLLHIAAVHPHDPLTRLRLSHPRVHAAVVLPVGGLELFEACGYKCTFEVWPVDDTTLPSAEAEAWLVLDGATADTSRLAAGASLLRELAAAAASPNTSSTDLRASSDVGDVPVTPLSMTSLSLGTPRARTSPPDTPRRHRVLLPTSSAAALDDKVAALLPLESATAIVAAVAAEARASKAARSLRAVASAPSATALIHVACPEGFILAARFRGEEPVSALTKWVASLLSPGAVVAGWTLTLADGAPLVEGGTLDDAGLWCGGELVLTVKGGGTRALADGVVARAVPAPGV